MTIFLVLVLIFLVSQIFVLSGQKETYSDQAEESFAEANVLEVENNSLRSDLEYFKDDENLSKELRAQFNYRSPDEELLILVPADQDD